MRILITGGAGFIGANLAAHLLKAGHDVTLFDTRAPPHGSPLLNDARCAGIVGDITDASALDAAVAGHDAIVHLAAMVSVPETIERPEQAVRVNEEGSRNVLRAATRHGVKKVVLASSAAVYGENPPTPTKETAKAQPMSPYATTKLAMERHAAACEKIGLATCCLRFFNVYGPGQDPKSQYAAAIPAFISRAQRGDTITIYGDGEQTRDFIYVADVCRACELALTKGRGSINIATGKSVTINEVAATIVALTKSASEIVHVPARAGDPRTSLADVAKAKQELGFLATTRLEDGLRATVASFESKRR